MLIGEMNLNELEMRMIRTCETRSWGRAPKEVTSPDRASVAEQRQVACTCDEHTRRLNYDVHYDFEIKVFGQKQEAAK